MPEAASQMEVQNSNIQNELQVSTPQQESATNTFQNTSDQSFATTQSQQVMFLTDNNLQSVSSNEIPMNQVLMMPNGELVNTIVSNETNVELTSLVLSLVDVCAKIHSRQDFAIGLLEKLLADKKKNENHESEGTGDFNVINSIEEIIDFENKLSDATFFKEEVRT